MPICTSQGRREVIEIININIVMDITGAVLYNHGFINQSFACT